MRYQEVIHAGSLVHWVFGDGCRAVLCNYGRGIGGFFNVVISFVLAYIPFIGSITGVYGAVAVWDWNLFAALALFFWMLPVGVIFAAIDAISGRR